VAQRNQSSNFRFAMSFNEVVAGEARCQSCDAAITWRSGIRKKDGKPYRMPMEIKGALVQKDGTRMLESHFAHCNDADSWRKPR